MSVLLRNLLSEISAKAVYVFHFLFLFFHYFPVDSIQLKQQNLDVVVSVVTVRKDCA